MISVRSLFLSTIIISNIVTLPSSAQLRTADNLQSRTDVSAPPPIMPNQRAIVRYYAPPAKSHVSSVDYTQCPDRKELCDVVVNTCDQNYDLARSIIGVPDGWADGQIKIVLVRGQTAPSATSGNTILLNADYLHEHNDDVGCEVWQLAVVFYQGLPRPKSGCKIPGWFIGGCADVVRAQARDVPKGAWCAHCLPDYNHYDRHSQCGAAFLMFVDRKYKQAKPILAVNKLVFKGEYTDDIWKELTGKTLEELWQEYLSQPASKGVTGVIYVTPECSDGNTPKEPK